MKLLNGFYQLCWIICYYLQMGIPTTAVHAWVLKNTDCSFWSPACDGGALPSRPTPTASQTGCPGRLPQRPRQAAGRGWAPKPRGGTAPVQRPPPFCSQPTRPTHSAVANHESIWSVHCHSKGLFVVSKPSSSLPWRCSELEMSNISEQVLLFPWDLLFGLFDPRGLQMNACFPLLCQNIWWCTSLLLKVWPLDRQHQHPWGTC